VADRGLPGVEVAAIHLPPPPAPTAPAEEPVLVWTVNPARIPGLAVAELVEAMRLAGQARITFQVGDANVTAAVA
jgi:hypothetical protein